MLGCGFSHACYSNKAYSPFQLKTPVHVPLILSKCPWMFLSKCPWTFLSKCMKGNFRSFNLVTFIQKWWNSKVTEVKTSKLLSHFIEPQSIISSLLGLHLNMKKLPHFQIRWSQFSCLAIWQVLRLSNQSRMNRDVRSCIWIHKIGENHEEVELIS